MLHDCHYHPGARNTQITSLNDYQPVAVTPIMKKCFERLVNEHITSRLPHTFDAFQFNDWPKRYTEDIIFSALPLSLAHLDKMNTRVQVLFLDFSSALNTIIPQHLVDKLGPLGFSIPPSMQLVARHHSQCGLDRTPPVSSP